MSETAADREFYAAVEAAFIRRRGTPFLLSPRDFELLKEWRALGVPLEAVAQGIDDAFSRREERGATGRVNSLAYCRDAVLVAWERRAETAVGKGAGREGPEPEVGPALDSLGASLEAARDRRPDLSAPIDAALRSLARLRGAGTDAGPVEASLARLDRRLAGALLDALAEPERAAIASEAEARLAGARDRMDDAAAERTRHALERRLLRERLDLPRLTLLP